MSVCFVCSERPSKVVSKRFQPGSSRLIHLFLHSDHSSSYLASASRARVKGNSLRQSRNTLFSAKVKGHNNI
eukprot:6191227-Pleurochrysis_carterae.AAC.1